MSTISSTFTDLYEAGMEDEYDDEYEPPEIKYNPPMKIEVPDDVGNEDEEDVDDNFLTRAMLDDEDEEHIEQRENSAFSQSRRSRTTSRTTDNVHVKIENSFDELDESDNDRGCTAEDKDWFPDGKKRRIVPQRGRGPGKRRRLSSDQRRKRNKERKRIERAIARIKVEDSKEINANAKVNKVESKKKATSSEVKGRRNKKDDKKAKVGTKRQSMTPEEREAEKTRRREYTRNRRAQLRNAKDPETQKKWEEERARCSEQAKVRRALLKERDPEKFERMQAEAREKLRLKRALLRQSVSKEKTPEKLEEMRAKSVERVRKMRELGKLGALPEDRLRSLEIQKERDRERKRAKRAAMTPEEKKAEYQKNYSYVLSKRSRLQEDDIKEIQIRKYMQNQAKLAEETPEERERRIQKKRERGRLHYQRKKDTMDREKVRERQRQWWHGMNPEKKEQYKERYRAMYRKRIETLKEDPEKWIEIKKQWAERDKLYRQQRRQRRQQTDNPENKAVKRRKAFDTPKKGKASTVEQREQFNERRRERELKRKLAIQKLLDSGMTMEQIKQQTETPEQRERRCIQMRIRKARRVLRARLQNLGATLEEIKCREEELKRTYQPIREFRPYKPRFDTWKIIDPNVVSKLEAEGKLDDLLETEPLALLPKPRPRKPKLPILVTTTVTTTSTTTTQHTNIASLTLPELPQKRKGRPPRSSTSQKQIKSHRACTLSHPTANIQNYQQQPSSLSMPTLTPCPQLNYSHSQYRGHPSTSYHQQHSALSTSVMFEYPQQLQQISQPHSLQSILDSPAYHQHPETETGYAQNFSNTQQATYSNYDSSATSSQHEYESSYQDDDANYDDVAYSPPASPAGTDDDDAEDCSNYVNMDKKPRNCEYLSTVIKRKRTTTTKSASKEKKKKPELKYIYRPSKNPNAKLRGSRVLNPEKRTILCDQCTASFTLVSSLEAHKKQFHNPNYDVQNRICRVCGETFRHAQVWLSHYYNVHEKPKMQLKPKTFVCDLCGSALMSMTSLLRHQYIKHNNGLRLGKDRKCPVCKKHYTSTTNFYKHVLAHHSGQNRGIIPRCYRCETEFSSNDQLKTHVQECHPDSYFPCPDCNAFRHTQLGLYNHFLSGSCPPSNSENKCKVKESFNIEKFIPTCEFCNKKLKLASLTGHYNDVHGAKEELFQCSLCQRQFKDREFWAIHLGEKHGVPIDEIISTVRKLNMTNRKGVNVKPVYRKKWRTMLDPVGNKRSHKKARSSEGRESDDDDDASDTQNYWSSDSMPKNVQGMIDRRKRIKKRRKIVVIAEEDEMDIQSS